jgi:hypothetical protein
MGDMTMERAPRSEAAGGQAALAAKCSTDMATLARVAAALYGQFGGRPPLRREAEAC